MTKGEIFREIREIVRCDAAFCREKFPFDEGMESPIREDMTDEEFVFSVNSYLCRFRVPGHLRFFEPGRQGGAGIRTERFENFLLVTAAARDSGFSEGDRIVSLDGLSVGAAEERYGEFFFHQPPERQGIFWEWLLPHFGTAEVLRKSGGREQTRKIPIRKDLQGPKREPYRLEILPKAVFLRFDDFENENAVKELLAGAEAAIKSHEFLIIDIRENGGGSDTAFLPLLPLCIAEGEEPDFTPDPMEINDSARNVDLRLETLRAYLATASEETKPLLKRAMEELKDKRGRGFLPVESGPAPRIDGTAYPKKVFVLIGPRCASSGEAFALAVKGLRKVTLLGRPTMGILRYSNCAEAKLGKFVLVYPTSVLQGACGAEPDVFIGRTCDLSRDPELEWALQEIGENKTSK